MADMTRRSFLKLLGLATASIAVQANPILSAAAKLAEADPTRVLIYLVYNIKRKQYEVRGTRYLDLSAATLHHNYDPETFKVLDIVANEEATARRKELWYQHTDARFWGGRLDVNWSKRNGEAIGRKAVENNHAQKYSKIIAEGRKKSAYYKKVHGANMRRIAKEYSRHPNKIEAARKVWIAKYKKGTETQIERSKERIQQMLALIDQEVFGYKQLIPAAEAIGMTSHWMKKYVIGKEYVVKIGHGKYIKNEQKC